MKTFEYYQIRCCVQVLEPEPHVISFSEGCPAWAEAQAEAWVAENPEEAGDIFWTLYGVEEDGCSRAIGDFVSFEYAYEVLCMILAPLRTAADYIAETTESAVGLMLEDICNQSTTEDRL